MRLSLLAASVSLAAIAGTEAAAVAHSANHVDSPSTSPRKAGPKVKHLDAPVVPLPMSHQASSSSPKKETHSLKQGKHHKDGKDEKHHEKRILGDPISQAIFGSGPGLVDVVDIFGSHPKRHSHDHDRDHHGHDHHGHPEVIIKGDDNKVNYPHKRSPHHHHDHHKDHHHHGEIDKIIVKGDDNDVKVHRREPRDHHRHHHHHHKGHDEETVVVKGDHNDLVIKERELYERRSSVLVNNPQGSDYVIPPVRRSESSLEERQIVTYTEWGTVDLLVKGERVASLDASSNDELYASGTSSGSAYVELHPAAENQDPAKVPCRLVFDQIDPATGASVKRCTTYNRAPTAPEPMILAPCAPDNTAQMFMFNTITQEIHPTTLAEDVVTGGETMRKRQQEGATNVTLMFRPQQHPSDGVDAVAVGANSGGAALYQDGDATKPTEYTTSTYWETQTQRVTTTVTITSTVDGPVAAAAATTSPSSSFRVDPLATPTMGSSSASASASSSGADMAVKVFAPTDTSTGLLPSETASSSATSTLDPQAVAASIASSASSSSTPTSSATSDAATSAAVGVSSTTEDTVDDLEERAASGFEGVETGPYRWSFRAIKDI